MIKMKQILVEASNTDLLKKLDSLFKEMDWTYEMSDDHRYYVKGTEDWKNIKEISVQLVKAGLADKVKQIFKKYETNYTKHWYKYKFEDILKFAKNNNI